MQFGAPTFASLGTPGDGYSIVIPFHQFDAHLEYGFKSGPFKGVAIFIEGTNLNNAPPHLVHQQDPRQLANWQKYGAAYNSGISYRF